MKAEALVLQAGEGVATWAQFWRFWVGGDWSRKLQEQVTGWMVLRRGWWVVLAWKGLELDVLKVELEQEE